jgi:hypothetical protein
VTSKQRDIVENAACLAVLLLLALVVLGPCWTAGKVPFSTDYAFTLAPWHSAAPTDLSDASAALSREETLRYYPGFVFMSDAAARNDSILWNPAEGGGAPFLAQWRTRPLSPFTIPFRLFALPTALALAALLKLVVAGWCAFYAGRRLGLQAHFALFVAVTFELGSAALLRTTAPVSDVIPWLPLLFLFAEQTASDHRSLWPFGSLVWALMLFGGDPETAIAAGLFVLLYTLLRGVFGRQGVVSTAANVGTVTGALVVGAGLSAIQIVPYLELLRHAASTGHAIVSTPLHWYDAALLLFPRFLDPSAAEPATALVPRIHALPLAHAGAVSATLLALGMALRRFIPEPTRARVEALVTSAMVFSVAGAVLGGLPLFRRLGLEHYLIGNAFALGVAGATAAQQWIHLNAKQCMDAVPRFLIFLAVGVLTALGLMVGVIVAGAPDVHATLGGVLLAAALFVLVLALLAATLIKPISRALGYGLAVLALLGLWLAFPGVVPFSAPSRLFPETEFIGIVKHADRRVVGSGPLADWPLAGNDVPQLYSASGLVLDRQALFGERLAEDPLLVRRTGSSTLFLTKEDIQGPFADIRNALVIADPNHVLDSGAVLFQDTQGEPRARMVYVGRSLAADSQPVKSDLPPLMETQVAPNQPTNVEAEVTILPPENNGRVRIRVQHDQPGVLVLADGWYPGWRAAVDGVEKDIFAVDLMFRGIAVVAGDHEVEFIYAPLSLDLGTYISAGAGLLVAVALGIAVWAQRMSEVAETEA